MENANAVKPMWGMKRSELGILGITKICTEAGLE
jgi:hypothetical protein